MLHISAYKFQKWNVFFPRYMTDIPKIRRADISIFLIFFVLF
ncbi:hypothetical protein [Azospirillum argentinense]|uniref:Uncharacterized protein n=1 Tax=Azospirillum argentinense TaxID=2970906 RepID=A0A5B0KSS9_9PROT|nr:hypothetical protein FH063_005513 [Azospirillum argentinense]